MSSLKLQALKRVIPGSVRAVSASAASPVAPAAAPAATPDRSEGDINVTARRAAYMAEHVSGDAATARLLKEDEDVFLHQTLSTPCMNALSGARAETLTDTVGRTYLDFHGNSTHQVGWGNPAVVAAVTEQMQTLPFCPRRFTNEKAVRLAQRLVHHAETPSPVPAGEELSRVLFTPGGALSIGVALKLARIHTGRFKTLSMWESFHGASLDAIGVGGEAVFRRGIGPLLPGATHAPPPNEHDCRFKCGKRGGCDLSCAEYVEYVMEHEGDIGAVLAEPIRYTPYIPRKGYWERIRAACDKHGALLIFDEIPNSLGRTGTHMFTYQHFGVQPDIVVVGKGLGGGIVPLSAVVAKEKLNEACKTHALGHYTHEKSPVASAAGLATLDYIEEHGLVANAKTMGDFALAELRKALLDSGRYPVVHNVRGVGLLIGIELRDPETQEKALDAAEGALYGCMARGLSFKVTGGNVLTWCPPLTVSQEQILQAVAILEEALGDL